MRGLTSNTYTVKTVGGGSHLSAVLSRLSPQSDALGQNTLNLQVAEPDAPGAVHSRLTVPGEKRDREWLQSLARAHDALVTRVPNRSVLLGGLNGRCTVLEVAREDTLPTARLQISWWEEQKTAEAGHSRFAFVEVHPDEKGATGAGLLTPGCSVHGRERGTGEAGDD